MRRYYCAHPDCNLQSSFNYPTESFGIYCSKHKKIGMINVIKKRCMHPDCNTCPVYNYSGENLGIYCKLHKKPEMIDVKCKRCAYSNCNKRASFNNSKEHIGKYCKIHKKPEMIDVKCKRCEYSNCNKRASFNDSKEHTGKYCNLHKQLNMINVTNKRCVHPNCNKKASFGDSKEHIGKYCGVHKQPDMINVTSNRCAHPNCNIWPLYNYPGERAKFCCIHKKPDMIDVKHKPCDELDCKKPRAYGYIGNSATRCAEHKKSGMIRKPNKKCIICKDKARYMTNDTSFYCEQHKPNMAKEFGDICIICCADVNHGEIMCKPCIDYQKRGCTLKRGLKEQAIKAFLDKEADLCDYVHDVPIQDGCSKQRPDFVFRRAFNTIILEVDEEQHRYYNCSCESSRMKNIYHSNGESNMTFIRYNPDEYKPAYGSVLAQSKRHDLLKKILIEECNAPEDRSHGIKVVYLFYDGFSELNLHVDWINPYLIED